MAIVDLSICRNIITEAEAHATHLDRLAASNLQHNIHIMHAAVHDRIFHILEETFMNGPRVATRALIQVHAHDKWWTELSSAADELDPAGMMPKDIADD